MINVALPKGRLGETAYETLAAAGYDCPAILEKTGSSPLRIWRRASVTSGSSPRT